MKTSPTPSLATARPDSPTTTLLFRVVSGMPHPIAITADTFSYTITRRSHSLCALIQVAHLRFFKLNHGANSYFPRPSRLIVLVSLRRVASITFEARSALLVICQTCRAFFSFEIRACFSCLLPNQEALLFKTSAQLFFFSAKDQEAFPLRDALSSVLLSAKPWSAFLPARFSASSVTIAPVPSDV